MRPCMHPRAPARPARGFRIRPALLGLGLSLAALAQPLRAGAQSTTPPSQPGVFLISGGTVVTMTGPAPQRSDVLIRDGRIAAVGQNLPVPADAVRIDATGRTVYPGLIDSQTAIGLEEMTHESDDRVEMERLTPYLRTISAVNAHSNAIPLARSNGITAAVTQPAGGLIPGPAALVQLDGWTWEEMGLLPQVAMVINYPRSRPRGFGAGGAASGRGPDAEVAELRAFLQKAREYERDRTAGTAARDFSLESMRPVFRRELPVAVRADAEEEIRGAVALAEEFGLRMVLMGANDAWRVAPLLAEKQIPVVLGSILEMPDAGEPYDAVFAQPAALHRAGVKFAFSTGSTSGARNLAYHAGMATAYGLSPEAALRALTVTPAEIWGVSGELGTIEPGKRANLVVADGDILDVRTRVLEVFVDGRRASHDDRHTRLYRNFSDRPRP